MTTTQRSQLERSLQEERARVQRVLTRLDPPAAGEEAGRFGDDLASRAASGPTTDDDRAIVAHARRDLDELDSALRMLYEHPESYGTCRICGRPIALARLALVPTTRLCQRHASG